MMNLKTVMMTWMGQFLWCVIAKILSPHNGCPQHPNLMPARLLRGKRRKSGRPPSCEMPPLRSLERAITVKILSKYHYFMMNILILGFRELFILLSGLLQVVFQFADLSMVSELLACYSYSLVASCSCSDSLVASSAFSCITMACSKFTALFCSGCFALLL